MVPSGLSKTVLSAPAQMEASGSNHSPSTPNASVILSRLKFSDDVSDRSKPSAMLKENHLKRMKFIRKEIEKLDDDAWKFEPIENFIGQ